MAPAAGDPSGAGRACQAPGRRSPRRPASIVRAGEAGGALTGGHQPRVDHGRGAGRATGSRHQLSPMDRPSIGSGWRSSGNQFRRSSATVTATSQKPPQLYSEYPHRGQVKALDPVPPSNTTVLGVVVTVHDAAPEIVTVPVTTLTSAAPSGQGMWNGGRTSSPGLPSSSCHVPAISVALCRVRPDCPQGASRKIQWNQWCAGAAGQD